MKKFLATILAIIYLITTSGATVHMHYCMGELVEKSLWHNDKVECSNCSMEKNVQSDNDCCKDEQKQLKIDTDQNKTINGLLVLQVVSVAIPTSYPAIAFPGLVSITEENPNSNAPPRSWGIALYKRYCVYLI